MPLFAATPSAAGEAAFASFAGALPFYAGRPVQRWSDGSWSLLWVTEEDEPGATRVRTEGAVTAAWFGRPILWSGGDVLGGGAFLAPMDTYADDLDGRCAVLRFENGELDVYADPGGAYPVYECDGWTSNSPALVAALAGREAGAAPREGGATAARVAAALAGIVGGGWSLSGDPPVAGVRRLAPETTWRLDSGGARPGRVLLDRGDLAAAIGRPLHVEKATAALSAALRAQADWPGRPNVVALSGGRDSRVILAAGAGLDWSARTGGSEADADVRIAQELARRAGVAHDILGAVPGGGRADDPVRAAEILWALTGGTASLADGAGFPLASWESPRPLWHTGQGGEIARRAYGQPADVDALERRFLALRPGRPPLLTADGRALVRDELQRFVTEARDAGCAPADLGELFYVLRRMGTWAGPTHAAVEPVRDATSVLWSRRVVPLLLGGTREERAREAFHRGVVAAAAPGLTDVPFQDGTSWTAAVPGPRARLRAKLVREARRRLAARRKVPAGPSADPRARLLDAVRERVLAAPPDGVTDRAQIEALLGLPPDAIDEWRWYQVWRLATLHLIER